MTSVTVHHGDSRDVLKGLADASIDSCVCDPPYALVSIVKRFGKPSSAEAKSDGPSGVYKRASAGFMGQSWDTGETAFDPAFWVEVLRVLKPGGHVLAFGAGRGVHHLATAIETAGFEIRDRVVELIAADTHACAFLNSLDEEQQNAFLRCVEESTFGGELAWIFGSGFPKSHDVSKGIDKAAGATRRIVSEGKPVKRMIPGADQAKAGWEKANGRTFTPAATEAATEAAKRYDGWGTALKPALEPIIVARKPLESTVAANVLKHGTGALNIDGCRVGDFHNTTPPGTDRYNAANHEQGYRPSAYGRDGEPSAERRYADKGATNFAATPGPRGGDAKGRWPANVVHDGSDEVLAAFPTDLKSGAGAVKRASAAEHDGNRGSALGRESRAAGTPMISHGDFGSAARFFYSAKADAEDRLGSKHPTVKPVDLMQWLCRLVTPPGGVVLDPFAGSGSTGLAAMNEGFDCILIEREAKFVADINRRIAWARGEGRLTTLELARDIEPANAAGLDMPLFAGNAQPASQPASVSSTGPSPATPYRADGDEKVVAA